jgi:superoxide dismutase
MVDFGIKRPDHINAFMENIKWSEVSRRFGHLKTSGNGGSTHEQRVY